MCGGRRSGEWRRGTKTWPSSTAPSTRGGASESGEEGAGGCWGSCVRAGGSLRAGERVGGGRGEGQSGLVM